MKLNIQLIVKNEFNEKWENLTVLCFNEKVQGVSILLDSIQVIKNHYVIIAEKILEGLTEFNYIDKNLDNMPYEILYTEIVDKLVCSRTVLTNEFKTNFINIELD